MYSPLERAWASKIKASLCNNRPVHFNIATGGKGGGSRNRTRRKSRIGFYFTNTGTSTDVLKIDFAWSAFYFTNAGTPTDAQKIDFAWTAYISQAPVPPRTPRDFEGSLVRFLKTVLKTVDTSRAFPENRAAS